MREQLQLVPGVESDQLMRLPGSGEQHPQPRVGENPLGKFLSRHRVVQPALILGGEQGELGHHPLREQAAPAVAGRLVTLGVARDAVTPQLGDLALKTYPSSPAVRGSAAIAAEWSMAPLRLTSHREDSPMTITRYRIREEATGRGGAGSAR
jgi:hypothetical protein